MHAGANAGALPAFAAAALLAAGAALLDALQRPLARLRGRGTTWTGVSVTSSGSRATTARRWWWKSRLPKWVVMADAAATAMNAKGDGGG